MRDFKITHFAVLGDIHGDFEQIKKAMHRYRRDHIPVFSVGDVGLGFPYQKKQKGIWVPDPTKKDPESFDPLFRFVRGNHDSPEVCRAHPNYLGDYGVEPQTGIFFISGAMSVDRGHRTQGLDWWPDEELSINELNAAIDLYEKTRPSVVISHDCPLSVYGHLRTHHQHDKSRTAQALEAMWQIHRPDIWCHGHHHVVWQKKINGTLFVCAAINQTLKFSL